MRINYVYACTCLALDWLLVHLLCYSSQSGQPVPPLVEDTVCPKSLVRVGAQLCRPVGVMRVWGWRWGAVPKVRTDNALASTDLSAGCVLKERMGQTGVEAGSEGGPGPPPGAHGLLVSPNRGLFDFWVHLEPDLQPGLRDAFQG